MKGRGCSIRLHELGDFIAALRSAEALVGVRAPPRRDDSPQYVERRRRPGARPLDPAEFPPPGGAREFDEFDNGTRSRSQGDNRSAASKVRRHEL